MILRSRIEVGFAARHWRRDALVLLAHLPPCLVVIGGLDLAAEHLPPPLVDEQSERQERDFVQRHMQQVAGVIGLRNRCQQANLVEVLGRDGQRDSIANGLVEPVIGAALEQERLLLVGALIEVVSQLVVDGDEIFAADLDAHFQAQVVEVVDVPGAGVADDFAVLRLDEQRALPERLGQRRKPHRGEEAFAILHHADGVDVLLLLDGLPAQRLNFRRIHPRDIEITDLLLIALFTSRLSLCGVFQNSVENFVVPFREFCKTTPRTVLRRYRVVFEPCSVCIAIEIVTRSHRRIHILWVDWVRLIR